MGKALTFAQVEDRKRRAEQFLRDVKQDDERADEVSDESVESYAERRGFEIIDNPGERSLEMANGSDDPRTKSELLDYISDLEDQLDAIQDIISPPPEDEDEDGDGDDSSAYDDSD